MALFFLQRVDLCFWKADQMEVDHLYSGRNGANLNLGFSFCKDWSVDGSPLFCVY